MGAETGRRHQRGGAARTAGFRLDALEPRTLFSGSFHDLSGGLCIEPIAPGYTTESAADVRATSAASLDLSQTFRLHSLPGARHTIYLDFNGFTTTGTQWNTYAGRGSFTSPAYSTDGSAAFGAGELTNIQQIWQRVAEDFAPFNVNVTTAEPPAHALIRSGAGDTAWGVRVVVGGSSEEWLGVSAGGVAWIGSFNWNSDTPVFVFEDHLGNGNEKLTAEAISHEVGHALGLDHDGHFDHEHDADEEYYEGHGSGESGWAPLMGVGYYRHLTQWSRGQYAGATNPQDDLSIITTRNGFGYRADDTGDTLATATPLSISGGATSISGLIERNTDADVYAFSTSGGSVSFGVDPAERGPNLDVLAEILDAAGNVLAAANPSGVLSAHLNAALSAGTYYLRVSGAGEPNGAYTDYASLGQYTITGEVQAAATPPTLSLNNTATYEGNGWARMSIILSEASDTPVSVVWGTTTGTARSAHDFNGRAGYVVFQPGQVQKFIYVRLIDDRLRENTERMWVGLMNVSGATIGRGWGSLYVLDNDPGAAARRTAQAKAAATARAASASTPAAAHAWQLQRAQQSAAGFQWSASAAGDDADGQADDLLAQLPAVA